MIPPTQAARLVNGHLIANSVCAACHGALVDRGAVQCATCGCTKFISRRELAEQTHAALTAADAQRQPWLTRKRETPPEQAAGLAALFGKGVDGGE